MTLRPAATTTLTSALLVTIATLPLRDVFGNWSWSIAVIGAAVTGAVVASAIETLRRDVPVGAIVAITALGAVVWALVVPLNDTFFAGPTSAAPWQQFRDGVFSGWGALLDEQFPLTDPLAAETFVAVLAWVAAASGVHVAARRQSALAAVGAGAAILWISSAAALPRGLTPAFFGAGAGAMALFAISTVTRAVGQRWRLGRAVALVAVIGLAGGLAMLAGTAFTSIDRDPFDPRASRATRLVEIEVPDLLAEFGVRRGQEQTVMSLESTEFPASLRLRLQVYETHDGERWLPATDFEELATFREPETLPPGEVVTLVVSIEDPIGPWVPLPDRVIRTDLPDLRWNDSTQTALTAEPLSRYEVSGTQVSRTGLEGQASARTMVPEHLSEIPAGLPDSIRSVAEAASADATDALGAIDAITARLRELGRDIGAAPGHSFGRLRDDLASGRATGAEQIASLHALMLRSIGIPSRVVVGYVATSPLVESADLHVWTEAAFPDGWVAFDPVPTATEGGSDIDDDPTATTTTVPNDSAVQARALPRELGPGEDPDEPDIGSIDELTLGDVAILGVIGVVLLLGLMITARLIRRRVRRSSGWRAEVRVLGAWAELVDRLRELGAPISATTTIDDIVYMAAVMDTTLGQEVEVMGELAAIALHSPGGSDPDEATVAWDQLLVVEARITAVRGRWSLTRRYVDPRVLRYRAPLPPPSRDGGHRSRATEQLPPR